MIDSEVRDGIVPNTDQPAVSAPQPIAQIDPDDQVVLQALTAMVIAVRHVNNAIAGNGAYPAREAVAAVGQVVTTLSAITRNLEAYVGDYSKPTEDRLVLVTKALADSGVP